MRTTPKQRRARRERAGNALAIPPDHEMGPSAEWRAKAQVQLEYVDNCAEWEADLINEYGFDRAVRAIRSQVTQSRSKAFLEAERRRNQAARWEQYKGRLPQGY